jgi:hypothetical protein
MAAINVKGFGGLAPRTSPNLLAPNQATVAENVNLYSGEIKPFYQPETLQTFPLTGDIQTLYLYNNTYWLTWNQAVDVVLNPLATDPLQRLYFTSATDVPRVTNLSLVSVPGDPNIYPNSSYILGVPRPTTPLKASATGVGGSGMARYVIYLYTFVTVWGEEGPPVATISNQVESLSGSEVDLTGFPSAAPTGYSNIVTCRIYRSEAGNTTNTWLWVADIPIGTTSYADLVPDTTLVDNDVFMPSQEWLPPPSNLQGLVSHPGGFLVGFSGNGIWCSVPYQCHAWPEAYNYTIPQQIVGLAVFWDMVVVLTDGYPYIFEGASPSVLQKTKFPERQPCVSKRSIITCEMGVAFASPDGVYMITNALNEFITPGSLITHDVFTRDDWVAYNPQEMHAVIMDRRYYGFYKTGVVNGITQGGAIVLDLLEPEAKLTELSMYPTAAFVQPSADQLYFACDLNGTNVLQEWEGASTRLLYTWTSKIFEVWPQNFAFGQVLADTSGGMTQAELTAALAVQAAQIAANTAMLPNLAGGAWGLNAFGTKAYGLNNFVRAPAGASDLNILNFTLTVDGTVQYSGAVTSSDPFPLPSGYVGREVTLGVSGNVPVKRMAIAGSTQELSSVVGQ